MSYFYNLGQKATTVGVFVLMIGVGVGIAKVAKSEQKIKSKIQVKSELLHWDFGNGVIQGDSLQVSCSVEKNPFDFLGIAPSANYSVRIYGPDGDLRQIADIDGKSPTCKRKFFILILNKPFEGRISI